MTNKNYISSINLPSGEQYHIKDNEAQKAILHGVCSTEANAVAKTVTLYKGDSSTAESAWASSDLYDGLTIQINFIESNTATNPTLNVNSSGAKPIYKYGTTAPGSTSTASWVAGSIINFTYDTNNDSSGAWIMNDWGASSSGGGASVTIDTAPPQDANSGDLWLDTTSGGNVLKVYDGTNWILVGSVWG